MTRPSCSRLFLPCLLPGGEKKEDEEGECGRSRRVDEPRRGVARGPIWSAEAAVGLPDALTPGLQQEGGVGAAAAEEEAPEEGPAAVRPVEAGAHLGVLLAEDLGGNGIGGVAGLQGPPGRRAPGGGRR